MPVIRPTQLPPFRVGTRRVSPVARCVLVVVPSLTTPPERPVASIGLRRAVLPSPSRLRARPPGCAFSGPPRVHFRYGPTTCPHPKDEVVEGLQDRWFPSGLPSQLRGFRFLPRQVYLLLNTSAFPGRTTGQAPFRGIRLSGPRLLLICDQAYLHSASRPIRAWLSIRTPLID